ncbi:hypothetical protein EAF00_008982 [Botryotinia globosa]|nr:hypothetical protein EAF00_008982 [Botryotinia globosa]
MEPNSRRGVEAIAVMCALLLPPLFFGNNWERFYVIQLIIAVFLFTVNIVLFVEFRAPALCNGTLSGDLVLLLHGGLAQLTFWYCEIMEKKEDPVSDLTRCSFIISLGLNITALAQSIVSICWGGWDTGKNFALSSSIFSLVVPTGCSLYELRKDIASASIWRRWYKTTDKKKDEKRVK